MPAIPPSEDHTADSEPVEPSPAPELPAPPRTVTRRAPRPQYARVGGGAAKPAAQASTPVEDAPGEPAPAPAPADEQASIDTRAPAVEQVPVAEQAPAVEQTPQAAPTEQPETRAEARPEPAAQPTIPEPETRQTRIEVPVPSVVRARERAEVAARNPVVLRAEALTKSYGQVLAAADVSFDVHAGSLTGVVGPNGAGKTTVLSMITGLNRPSSGRIAVGDIDVWGDGPAAKRVIGSLPDRLRLFDRLTGGQLLYYAGVLQGLDQATVAGRAAELASAFGLESALDRPVSDYSAGMQKKIGLACSMIHAPGVLVLDEPYETIDPVSASNVTEILEKYVAGGGSVIMSSHSLDLIQRICDHVVVIVDGSVVARGTVDEVRGGVSLEERFKHLTQPDDEGKGLEWLRGSSDSE